MTLGLLRARPRTTTLKMISAATDIPEGWLLSILKNCSINPCVDRVEHLYEYLSGKKLEF